MEMETVGRVLTEARIESLKDVWEVRQGIRAPDQARAVTVSDALVDKEALLLSLPTHLIKRLGLNQTRTKHVWSAIGFTDAAMYEPVRLTIMLRSCTMDVLEIPDGLPVLIGRLPLTPRPRRGPLHSDADRQPCARRRTRLRTLIIGRRHL